jgi:N-acetylglucosamine kinase-like BadF-type ATPase
VSAGSGPVVLGVDGGNTKTLAVVADADGAVLGQARGGCTDIYGAVSVGAALDELQATCAEALARAGLIGAELDAAAFSLAGADWPEDFGMLRGEAARRVGLAVEPVVVNDALGALRCGGPAWAGLSIVCGTGAAIGARHPDGTIFHLGFWPDGAGGRQLGADGLRAAYRAGLDLGPPTSLLAKALARFGAADALDLLHAFTRRGGRPDSDEDLLAPDVLDAAEEGDAVARGLVEEQARVMGRQARMTAARVELPVAGAPVVLTGGVLTHPSRLIGDLVMAELPGGRRIEPVPPPIVGAVLLALDHLGAATDAAALEAGLRIPLEPERSAAWAASRSST